MPPDFGEIMRPCHLRTRKRLITPVNTRAKNQ